MLLTVKVPASCPAERRYIVSLVFEEFLGLRVRIVVESRSDVAIVGGDGKELILSDDFFAVADTDWLEAASLPRPPLCWAQLPDEVPAAAIVDRQLPVLFGERGVVPLLQRESPNRLRCSLDILGTVFFLISRYEEMAAPAADDHGRYPVAVSIA